MEKSEREASVCVCGCSVRTHAAEQRRWCGVLVLDVQLQLSQLTLMNATLHFNAPASAQVCPDVEMDVNHLTAPFISRVFRLLLYAGWICLSVMVFTVSSVCCRHDDFYTVLFSKYHPSLPSSISW